jgi:thiol:disulfide interchange protein DsbC
MKPLHTLLAGLSVAGLAACAPNNDSDTPANAPTTAAAAGSPQDLTVVRTRVAKLMPDVKAEDIQTSVAPGLYQVQQGSYYAYVTADGKYMVQGDMVNLETGEEITEGLRKTARRSKIDALGEDNMIIFGPEKAEDKKYTVTVFTDVDCGFCRKLHSEIADYNKEGIAIRYVFFPRSGPETSSFYKAEAVWCSNDRKSALTQAKLGAPMNGNTQCANPVMKEWQLGQEFGLRGTPMLVLPDGEIVNGYVPAPALAQRLASLAGATKTSAAMHVSDAGTRTN